MSKLYVNEIYAKGSTNQAVGIDSNGRVTNPNAVCFRLRKDNANIGASTVVAFDDVIFDTASGWDSSNNRWVAPVAGYYSVSFNGMHNGQTATHAEFRVNGSVIQQMRSTSTNSTVGNINITGSWVVYLDKDDYIDIRVVSGTMFGTTSNEGPQLSGFLIG